MTSTRRTWAPHVVNAGSPLTRDVVRLRMCQATKSAESRCGWLRIRRPARDASLTIRPNRGRVVLAALVRNPVLDGHVNTADVVNIAHGILVKNDKIGHLANLD